MFLLGHLVVGLIIGILLYWYFRDPVLIAASSIGSILPDLIDKPLGLFVFASAIGGRIYIHGLLFFLIVFVIGVLIWVYFHSFAGIAIALGVLSHQLLDTMWRHPINWYYPLFGPFSPDQLTTQENPSNYFFNSIIRELTNPSEWLMAVAIVLILIQILRSLGLLRYERLVTGITLILTGILAVCGVAILYCGAAGLFCLLTGWKDPLNNILAGMVIICVVVVVVVISSRKIVTTN